MANVVIRECIMADLLNVHKLYQQLQPEDTTTFEELCAGFDTMSTHPGTKIYVAECGGCVVGTYTLYILPNMTRNGCKAAILENIVVDADLRGQGVGRAMLEHARELAQEANCYKLSLTSNAKRTEAHEFYLRCGMSQHGISFRYAF